MTPRQSLSSTLNAIAAISLAVPDGSNTLVGVAALRRESLFDAGPRTNEVPREHEEERRRQSAPTAWD